MSALIAALYALLAAWLEEAVKSSLHDANAMVLATVDAHARPSSRVVLLRGLSAEGLTFYSNYESRKGSELAGSRHAAVLFYWPQLERQIRVEGDVTRLPAAASDARHFEMALQQAHQRERGEAECDQHGAATERPRKDRLARDAVMDGVEKAAFGTRVHEQRVSLGGITGLLRG